MSKQSDIVKVSQDAGTTGFVNTSGDTMTGQLDVDANVFGRAFEFRAGSNALTHGVAVHSTEANALQINTSSVERFKIDSAGRVTMPYQPAFYAGAATGSYTAGSVITFSNTAFDRGNNFNTTNSRFVAPVSGIYNLSIGVYLYNNTAQTTYQSIALRINGTQATFSGDNTIFYQGQTAVYDNMVMASLPVSLSANDYVDIGVRIGGSTLNVYGGHTYFSGYLLG